MATETGMWAPRPTLSELSRMDGAPLVSLRTAWNKAYAAAATGIPPDHLHAAIQPDGAAGAMTAAEGRRIAEAPAGRAAG